MNSAEELLFIQKVSKCAMSDMCDSGILASVTIAQAILESGYGSTDLAKNANNFFGMKCSLSGNTWDSVWDKVSKYTKKTSEQDLNGKTYYIYADFRKYPDMETSVRDHSCYLNGSLNGGKLRYAGLKNEKDYKKAITIIKKGGYATDVNYVDKICNIIERFNLTQYDKEESKMSNSSLVNCTVKSPNHSGQRTHSIDRITPHCVVGQLSAETIGACFPSGREASCNYGIGTDGRVCLIVDECNRSWCSSSNSNDQRAITIECASDKSDPYAMNDKVYSKLIELCTDICKRNGKKKLLWFADKNKSLNYEPKNDEMVITVHRWFANKSCPGDWLYSRLGDVANKVTSALGGQSSSSTPTTSSGTLYRVQCGAFSVKNNAVKLMKEIKSKGFDAFITEVNGMYKVQVGAYSVKANAENQLKAVKNAGFDAFITNVNGTPVNTNTAPQNTTSNKKSVNEIAQEVLNGKWGNGEDRKSALEKAGYNYSEVQGAVNKLVNGSSTTAKKSITEIAKEVIAGKWGNGEDRKTKLTQAGYSYSEVQAKVNELL